MSLSPDRMQRIWLQRLDAHLRCAHSHEVAAALLARARDTARAEAELERAAAERRAYAEAAAAHPEWTTGTYGRPKRATLTAIM
jgi:hypothetical protein